MSNLPITSRIKRSPLLLQVTDSIDPENPNVVTARGTIKGKPKTTTEEVTTRGKLTGKKDKKQMSNEQWAEYLKNETPEQKARRTKREINEGLREPDKKEIKTTDTPGEDSSWEETLKVKTTGDVFQPWETRQMSRSIKKEQRDIRRSKIKASKFGSQNKEGEWVAKEGISPRQQAKFDEAKTELEEFQAMATRNKAARGSGKKGGSADVTTGERDMTLSDVGGKKEQTAYLNEKYGTGDSSEVDAKNKEEQKKIREEGEAGMAADDEARKNKTGIYASAAEMKPSAFKMYAKSPATKKLQGAQNTLPQHLQDAIKAEPESPAKLGPLAAIAGKALIGAAINKLASSNKMRSGFKMKGYGKK